MRTTVTPDPDPQRPSARVPPFKQRLFSLGRPMVDLSKAGALAAELEDQEIIAKAGRDDPAEIIHP